MSEQNEVFEMPAKPMSSMERLYQIILSPGKVFDSILLKPNIIVPLVVCFLVAVVQVVLLKDVLTANMLDALKTAPQMQQLNLDPKQLNDILSLQVNIGIAVALVIAALSPLLGGAVSHLIAMFMGGEGRINESCSVTANGAVVYALGMVLAMPIAYLTQNYNFAFAANVFMAKDAFSPLYALLSFVNVFFIWQTVVTIMGFKKIHQFGMIKAAIAVLIPTLVVVIMSVAPLMTAK